MPPLYFGASPTFFLSFLVAFLLLHPFFAFALASKASRRCQPTPPPCISRLTFCVNSTTTITTVIVFRQFDNFGKVSTKNKLGSVPRLRCAIFRIKPTTTLGIGGIGCAIASVGVHKVKPCSGRVRASMCALPSPTPLFQRGCWATRHHPRVNLGRHLLTISMSKVVRNIVYWNSYAV